MEVLIIVQARSGSTRFPNKIFKKINGMTILELTIERIKLAKSPNEIVVATTDLEEDNSVEDLCSHKGIEVFRGSELNLLKRHYDCAVKYNANIVVKIPSDCPLIDPIIIDDVLEKIQESDYDYISNLHPTSYPDGFDVEAMTFSALEIAYLNAELPHELEHTTPYIWDNPHLFKIGSIVFDDTVDWSKLFRLTIDHPEDYILIRRIVESFASHGLDFGVRDIILLLQQNLKLAKINSHLIDDTWYNREANNLKTYDF